ncbi:phosphate propanoyltransferase [Moorellaceae bacterium AZ2]
MSGEVLPLAVPVGVSNRHMHMSQADLEVLFGPGYRLKPYRQLSQPGEYAAEETVTIVGPRGVIEGLRLLGPPREYSQIELALTDGYRLGIRPPVRESGDLEGTPGIAVVGPRGALTLSQGVILAARHIHMDEASACKYGLKDGQRVQVLVPGERGLIFDNVIVRVSPEYRVELHLDTDEANAALLKNGDLVHILRP